VNMMKGAIQFDINGELELMWVSSSSRCTTPTDPDIWVCDSLAIRFDH